jgi:iron complex transport system substrate-binding protein
MRTRGIDARLLSLDAHTIDEIQQTIRDVAAALRLEQAGQRLLAAHEARIARVETAIAGRARPRVLALEWLDPPFAPGHWLPEMIEIAGGENLVGTAGDHSTQHAWEDVADLDPDVLIIMPCGYGLEASITDANRFAADLRRVAPRAIDSGRAFAVDGSAYFNRSGPRYIDGIEILAGLLHPDVFPAPDSTVAATWRG